MESVDSMAVDSMAVVDPMVVVITDKEQDGSLNRNWLL
jgi:hypothetical protein